jgi:hypothetical protein
MRIATISPITALAGGCLKLMGVTSFATVGSKPSVMRRRLVSECKEGSAQHIVCKREKRSSISGVHSRKSKTPIANKQRTITMEGDDDWPWPLCLGRSAGSGEAISGPSDQ